MCFFLVVVVVVIVFVLGHGLDVVVGVINVHGGWVVLFFQLPSPL